MVSKRIIKGVLLGLGLLLANGLLAQKDVLLPLLKTDQFYLGEKVTTTDKRFKQINAEMGLYQPEIIPLHFMNLQIDEALVSIEDGSITRIVLFVTQQQAQGYSKKVIDEKLGKLNLKNGEEGADTYWKTDQYEIILQQGMDGDVVYLQPLSPGEENVNPGTKN